MKPSAGTVILSGTRIPGSPRRRTPQLPVYASISEVPSDEEIQRPQKKSKTFCGIMPSYSLSLEPFSQSIPLSQELLYEQKRGFCIHFATVGTQLFRMYGIPARYVTGYSVLPDMLRTDPQMGYTAQVPDSRAHAWVEVYTQSAGWIPVEVTPSAQLPVSQTEGHQRGRFLRYA